MCPETPRQRKIFRWKKDKKSNPLKIREYQVTYKGDRVGKTTTRVVNMKNKSQQHKKVKL